MTSINNKQKEKEIGGFIELEKSQGSMPYTGCINVNSGRNAFSYVLKAKRICKIMMPRFLCDSCNKALIENNVDVIYYSIGFDFKPIIDNVPNGYWIYLVNYYGQLSNEFLLSFGSNIIIDNSQAFFQNPISNISTIYNCRKYFGVPDGAFLFCDTKLTGLKKDCSYSRMSHLLGRFEKNAHSFYNDYLKNNLVFRTLPLMKMSKLTENILRTIDYNNIKKVRTKNYSYLHEQLMELNPLHLSIPDGPFMYPFYSENAGILRKKMLEKKIYIPILWPSVIDNCNPDSIDYKLAKNILPLPVDQRYNTKDMKYIVTIIKEILKNEH